MVRRAPCSKCNWHTNHIKTVDICKQKTTKQITSRDKDLVLKAEKSITFTHNVFTDIFNLLFCYFPCSEILKIFLAHVEIPTHFLLPYGLPRIHTYAVAHCIACNIRIAKVHIVGSWFVLNGVLMVFSVQCSVHLIKREPRIMDGCEKERNLNHPLIAWFRLCAMFDAKIGCTWGTTLDLYIVFLIIVWISYDDDDGDDAAVALSSFLFPLRLVLACLALRSWSSY